MTAQLTNLHDEPDRELAPVLGQLSLRFPHLPEQCLHELARTGHERFRDAPVRTFIPLLGAYRRDGLVGSAAARGALFRASDHPDQR